MAVALCAKDLHYQDREHRLPILLSAVALGQTWGAVSYREECPLVPLQLHMAAAR